MRAPPNREYFLPGFLTADFEVWDTQNFTDKNGVPIKGSVLSREDYWKIYIPEAGIIPYSVSYGSHPNRMIIPTQFYQRKPSQEEAAEGRFSFATWTDEASRTHIVPRKNIYEIEVFIGKEDTPDGHEIVFMPPVGLGVHVHAEQLMFWFTESQMKDIPECCRLKPEALERTN